MPGGVASAATAVVVGHVAGAHEHAARRLRRDHAAQSCRLWSSPSSSGTLASLNPGRIDLGVGRAPGTDPLTMQALRRGRPETVESFPEDVMELQSYFRAVRPGQPIQAVPGGGLEVPIWMLGSSLFSAHLAASLGLPYAFASHFAPDHLIEALAVYRGHFQPSEALKAPYAIACVNVFAAESDQEATRLFTSLQQQFLKLRRGTPGLLPPPVASVEGLGTPLEFWPGCTRPSARRSSVRPPPCGRGWRHSSSVTEAGRADGDGADPRPRRPPAPAFEIAAEILTASEIVRP